MANQQDLEISKDKVKESPAQKLVSDALKKMAEELETSPQESMEGKEIGWEGPVLSKLTKKFENDPAAKINEVIHIIFGKDSAEIYDLTAFSYPNETIPDYKKIKELMVERKDNKYFDAHNHRYGKEQIEGGMGSIPSDGDFFRFLADDDEKGMIIAQQNPESGKVAGYFIFEKTEKTPKADFSFSEEFSRFDNKKDLEENGEKMIKSKFEGGKVDDAVWDYRVKAFGQFRGKRPPAVRQEALEEFLNKFDITAKYIPQDGFEYEKGTGFFPVQNKN